MSYSNVGEIFRARGFSFTAVVFTHLLCRLLALFGLSALTMKINNDVLCFAMLVHVWANYRAVSALVFRTLNTQRAHILCNFYIQRLVQKKDPRVLYPVEVHNTVHFLIFSFNMQCMCSLLLKVSRTSERKIKNALASVFAWFRVCNTFLLLINLYTISCSEQRSLGIVCSQVQVMYSVDVELNYLFVHSFSVLLLWRLLFCLLFSFLSNAQESI